MPRDLVSLLVDNQRIEHFVSYTIDADIYTPEDGFTLELANPEIKITPGLKCELYVNGTRELTGIIDRVNPSGDKSKRTLKVTGRDLMGWAVDSKVKEFITLQNTNVVSLARRLFKDAPFVKIKDIDYQENVKGRIKSKAARVSSYDTLAPLSQIEPGMTVFEVLSEYAKSRGLLFYCLPDGRFVFGKPKEMGTPAFSLINRRDGKGNNVKTWDNFNDISKRFSEVTVVGQKQGQSRYTADQINVMAFKKDPDFPFYKPFVLKDEYGGDQPALQARMALEKMRHDGFRVSYTVEGHSQNTKNWTINELASVYDDQYTGMTVDGTHLIYGRTFEKNKGEQGTSTKLKLGLPGLIA